LSSPPNPAYAQTRRHAWELVREAIDALFYTWLICSITSIAYHYTRWSRFWYLLILMILPYAAFWVEFIRWNTTVYVLEVRDGANYFRKITTHISFRSAFRGFPKETWQTGIKGELVSTKANFIERAIGYKHAEMTAGGRKAFDGDRIPSWFLDILDSRASLAPKTDLSESGQFGALITLYQSGLLSREEARSQVFRQLGAE